jgi:hypothetical protein
MLEMLKFTKPLFIAAATSIGLTFGHAEAAPQILGLVASNGILTPLQCQDGLCTGYLASFCLQEARDAPASGQEYRLAPVGGLTLVATRLDGRRLRIPAADLVTIRLRSGFSSVRISLSQIKLDGLGARTIEHDSLAVDVEPRTTILPVVAADDPDPQSPEEIAQATGPLRILAAKTFDGPGEIADAVRLVGFLINTLPPEEAPEAIPLDRLFRQAMARIVSVRFDPEGLADAEHIATSCQSLIYPPTSFALGACLESEQNSLLATLNEQFWAAVGGS